MEDIEFGKNIFEPGQVVNQSKLNKLNEVVKITAKGGGKEDIFISLGAIYIQLITFFIAHKYYNNKM